MLCLTRRPEALYLRLRQGPGADHPHRRRRGEADAIHIDGVAPGEYSLLVIHDENRNGKLDKALGMPREGFGFSRNPAHPLGPATLRRRPLHRPCRTQPAGDEVCSDPL